MNKYLHQDITDYIYYDSRRRWLDKIVCNYKKKTGKLCFLNREGYPCFIRSIQHIEENNITYLDTIDEEDGNVYLCEPEFIGIINGMGGRNHPSTSWVLNCRFGDIEDDDDKINDFLRNEVGEIPRNYRYTYEAPGWLKEVVDNS